MDLISAIIFAIGGVICHQRPERSFFWDAHQFPVCARCTGLYVSAAIGLAAWITYRAGRARTPWQPRLALRVLAIAAVPTAVSLATGALGIWDGTNITRAVLAIPLGLCAGVIVAAVLTKDLR
jgi:uncharacterized membrane protein